MDTLQVMIKPKHFKNAHYEDNEDCPLARALKEAYPELGKPSVVLGSVHFWDGLPYASAETDFYTYDSCKWNSGIYMELRDDPQTVILTLQRVKYDY